MHLRWAAATHPGTSRRINEDSYGCRDDLGLFVVADGMGGHVAGEVASRLTVEAVIASVSQTAREPGETDVAGDIGELATARLKTAIEAAHRRLATEVDYRPDLRGMATTAVVVLIERWTSVVAHIGDSRLYRLRAGVLTQLTNDHSWVDQQVRAGMLTAEAARVHPWRSVLTRALAGSPAPEVDIAILPVLPRDRLMLCSDGLFSVVSDPQIAVLMGAGDLQEGCDRLVEAANAAGGPDNITTVVIQIDAP